MPPSAGYLAGTFPSADVASRLATGGRVDLRTAGTATPAPSTPPSSSGPGGGSACSSPTPAKGALGAGVGRGLAGPGGAYAAATTSIAGHIAPVWTQFRGGKGVATSAGACLAVFPAYFPIDAAVAAVGAARSRNAEAAVRLSSTVWVAAAVLWWWRGWPNLWGPEPTDRAPAVRRCAARG